MVNLSRSQLLALSQIQTTGRCTGIYHNTLQSLIKYKLIDLNGGASLTPEGLEALNLTQ
jgi:hypothetical protein